LVSLILGLKDPGLWPKNRGYRVGDVDLILLLDGSQRRAVRIGVVCHRHTAGSEAYPQVASPISDTDLPGVASPALNDDIAR